MNISYEFFSSCVGITVAILSLLVTILIAWQIYDRIALRREMKVIAEDIAAEQFMSKTELLQEEFRASILNVYYSQCLGYARSKEWFKYIATLDSTIPTLVPYRNEERIEEFITLVRSASQYYSDFNEVEKEHFGNMIEHTRDLFHISSKIVDCYKEMVLLINGFADLEL